MELTRRARARRRAVSHAVALLALTAMVAACGPSDRVREYVATRDAASASSSQGGGPSGLAVDVADPGSSSGGTSGVPDATAEGGGADAGSTGGAAGSGSGGGGASSAPTAAPAGGNGGATDVGVTATSIKIGGTFFNGGFLDKYSQVTQQAATAYFRYINDQGGINGRRIEFLTCDTAGQAQGTAGCLNKFIQSDEVFALGPSLDFNLDTVQPTIENAGVPWVGTSGLYAEEFQSPMMFPTQMKGADVGAMIATFAVKDLGAKTLGVSWVTIGAGRPCLERAKQVATSLGASVIVDAVNEDVNNGLTSQVASIQSKKPDAVLFCNDPVNTVKFVQAAGSRGYKPPKGFIGGFVAADDVPEAMGRAGVGVYGFSGFDFYKSDSPDVSQFRQITEFYSPRIFHHFYTQAAYVGAVALVEALKAAGPNLTRQTFLDALRELKITTMGQTVDFANINSREATGIMLQADDNLQWKQVRDRFAAAG